MIIVACLECNTAVRIIGEPHDLDSLVGEDSEYWPDKFHCVTCDRICEGMRETEVEIGVLARMKVRDLSPQEMYAAQMGLGTPDEQMCNGSSVRELLEKPLKKVHGFDIAGTNRFCVTSIELETGERLHFGASPQGALVYRITRPISYVKKALEDV